MSFTIKTKQNNKMSLLAINTIREKIYNKYLLKTNF